jgi:hypothetical protein
MAPNDSTIGSLPTSAPVASEPSAESFGNIPGAETSSRRQESRHSIQPCPSVVAGVDVVGGGWLVAAPAVAADERSGTAIATAAAPAKAATRAVKKAEQDLGMIPPGFREAAFRAYQKNSW